MEKISKYYLLPFISLLTLQNSFSAPRFDKTPTQFCPDTMSAKKQNKIFSRVMNIGASYGHGCTTCETSLSQRDSMKDTNDLGWVRRNFLVQFLQRTTWKSEISFKHEFISVIENDPHANFANIYSKSELKETPYRSRWIYRPMSDNFSIMPNWQEEELLANSNFHDESFLIGGANIRKKKKVVKNREDKGHLYQTYPGNFYKDGARSKLIIDLAVDNATTNELFKYLTDEDIFKKLKKGEWKDKALRQLLIHKAATKITNSKPSLIFMVDTFFWDTVPLMFHYVKKEKPNSILFKLITSKLFQKAIDTKLGSVETEKNKIEDFFEVLRRVSKGYQTGRPVPIILARLIDNPGKEIISSGNQEAFGALIGTYIKTLTDIDLTEELTYWLKQIKYDKNTNNYNMSESYQKNLQNMRHSLKDGEKGLVKKLLVAALADLPVLIKSADKAFNDINKKIRTFTSTSNHNVHLVNADEFYLNFHNIIHPETMHPTVSGAKFMSDLIHRTTCSGAN